MDYEDQKRMTKGWRGRRYLACRAVSVLDDVIDQLGMDDGVNPPPDGLPGLPAISEGMRTELHNSAAVLLRMILASNDGRTSGTRLQSF